MFMRLKATRSRLLSCLLSNTKVGRRRYASSARAGIAPLLSVVAYALGVAALTACASTPAPPPLPAEIPDAFSTAGGAPPAAAWWKDLDDPGLNEVIAKALASNFTLEAARQRLLAARAAARRASGERLPALDLSGRAGSRARDDDGFDASNDDVELGLAASWELDLWGRIEARADAADFRAQASRAQLRDAALSLTAEIARTWYRLAEAEAQLALINAQMDTNATLLELLENRFVGGQVASVDILRQRRLLEANRQQRSLLRADAELAAQLLGVLAGEPPLAGRRHDTDGLPALPSLPDTGVPLELVRRRPDLRQARAALYAANRDHAAAVSARYPRLSISADATTGGGDADALFQDWAFSLAGNLLQPLFAGGALAAEVERSQAVEAQRLHEYAAATLTAFNEVESALVREQRQQAVVGSLREQLRLSQLAYQRLRDQYFNGASSYLDVLNALENVQSLQSSLIEARRARIEFRIALYRALAGPIPPRFREDA